MPFPHLVKRHCPEKWEHILVEHAANLIATVFAVDQIDLGPVVKKVLDCLPGGLPGVGLFNCCFLGGKAPLLGFFFRYPSILFGLNVFS
ncbi:hypothetical protein D9M68_855190 [compost metagenome]